MKPEKGYVLLVITIVFTALFIGIFIGRASAGNQLLPNNDSVNVTPSETYDSNDTRPYIENKLNINVATKDQLCLLPGIGEITAQKIIDYRTTNGSFTSIDELKSINGIGDKMFEAIKDYIIVAGK